MRAETDELFLCAWCGGANEIALEVSAGNEQSFVVDCDICCRPNLLSVHIDLEAETFTVEASRES